jgi:hypothetical protein
MMNRIKRHWRSISTGMLVASLLGASAFIARGYLEDDCCYPGAACCHPGAACCKGHQSSASR